jgi:serine/threonine protein kinase
MSIDSFNTLLAVFRRTELFAPEQVDSIANELVPQFRDPESLLDYLIEIDWLTSFQSQLLLDGRWDELTLGPYNILAQLGAGGVSEVFKAWDTLRGRVVALKVLHHHLAEKNKAVRQFQRELQAITRLSHPNIIKTFDAHEALTMHYFAMEFVEGMDLEKYIKQTGPLPVEQACDYARQAAHGLQHAHQSGLVHRDIKPANLFLLHPPLLAAPLPIGKRAPDPLVKVLDWGLARCLRDPAESDPQIALSEEELTEEKGSLIGTADYIAPEQSHDPTLVDIRADIYSLGCTLFYLLTGQPPFQGLTLMQKLMQHREDEPPSLREIRPDVPDELDAFVRKMLAKWPGDRPQIPLLVITSLRKFCGSSGARGSSLFLPSAPAPGTSIHLPRPQTQATISRPSRNGTNEGSSNNGTYRR